MDLAIKTHQLKRGGRSALDNAAKGKSCRRRRPDGESLSKSYPRKRKGA